MPKKEIDPDALEEWIEKVDERLDELEQLTDRLTKELNTLREEVSRAR